MTHPYLNLKDTNFWYKVMSEPHPGHIDPITKSLIINKNDKISTMGSCFAQHLSKKLASAGFNYFIPENNTDDISSKENILRNYGVYSARYGNIYTVRQAIQLFDRAFDNSLFKDHVWTKDNKFVDAFRPQIEPDCFESIEKVIEDRKVHLQYVKQIFLESDWLIFTLGLTEGWQNNYDGAIFPVAPGVFGGFFDSSEHSFINFSCSEVVSDLKIFIKKIIEVNPNIKILLTVSPVLLIATYENRHVLVSTVASKSILRVAADEIERIFSNVIYFPSYEIITSSANNYFENDLRKVSDLGVNHVMRMFSKHFMYSEKTNINENPNFLLNNNTSKENIVCDEELILKAIEVSGF